jgi:hypothetical protein
MSDAKASLKIALDPAGIARLKSLRVEGTERRLAYDGFADVHEHFAHVRPEFAGLPELCFTQTQLVILIRRSIALDENVREFTALWEAESKFLAHHLSSRWLISACDTFADYGEPTRRAMATMLVILINMTKLAQTERLCLQDETLTREKYDFIAERYRRKQPIELWDSMTAYSPYGGDMPGNMFRRMLALTDADNVMRPIARMLVQRAVEADTLLGRLAKINPKFVPVEFRAPVDSPPLAPER